MRKVLRGKANTTEYKKNLCGINVLLVEIMISVRFSLACLSIVEEGYILHSIILTHRNCETLYKSYYQWFQLFQNTFEQNFLSNDFEFLCFQCHLIFRTIRRARTWLLEKVAMLHYVVLPQVLQRQVLRGDEKMVDLYFLETVKKVRAIKIHKLSK